MLKIRDGFFSLTAVLRFSLILLCIGTAIKLTKGEVWSSFLFMHWGVADDVSLAIETAMAPLLLGYLLLLIAFPSRLSPFPLFMFFLLQALMGVVVGGTWFSEWQPFAQAARIVLPLALAMAYQGKTKRANFWIKLGLSFTFFFHGIEAWMHHPGFIDYLIDFTHRGITELQAAVLLKVVGVIDLVAAVGLFVMKQKKPALYWMLIWGMLTALVRVWEGGWILLPDTLIRLPHALMAYGAMVSSGLFSSFKRD
jgi:hypothetical protein